MIDKNSKATLARYIGTRAVEAVFYGPRLVWRLAQSKVRASSPLTSAKVSASPANSVPQTDPIGTMQRGRQTIVSRLLGTKTIAAIYHGASLVWQAAADGTRTIVRKARRLAGRAAGADGGIVYGGKDMEARYIGQRTISAVYKGAVLVWEAISSCFGSGAWFGTRPWSGKDGWRGNTK